ncbi:MAG: hypothetical protein Q8R26_02560 [bacterium]|nr:hypothetical protein [bacterium]
MQRNYWGQFMMSPEKFVPQPQPEKLPNEQSNKVREDNPATTGEPSPETRKLLVAIEANPSLRETLTVDQQIEVGNAELWVMEHGDRAQLESAPPSPEKKEAPPVQEKSGESKPKFEKINDENFEKYRQQKKELIVNGHSWKIDEVLPDGNIALHRDITISEALRLVEEYKGKEGSLNTPSIKTKAQMGRLDDVKSAGQWVVERPPRSSENPERQKEVAELKDLQKRLSSEEFANDANGTLSLLSEVFLKNFERLDKERKDYESIKKEQTQNKQNKKKEPTEKEAPPVQSEQKQPEKFPQDKKKAHDEKIKNVAESMRPKMEKYQKGKVKEEKKAAEAMMTPDQKKLSDAREQRFKEEKKAEKMITPEEKKSNEEREKQFNADKEAQEKLEKQHTIAAQQRERWGLKAEPVSIKKALGKGVIDTIGSVFGARAVWEVPKAIRSAFSKKGQRSDISKSTIDALEGARTARQERKSGIEHKEESHAVRDKLKELNERLKDSKLPPQEKKALRTEMAGILREYRNEATNLEKAKTERIGKTLDLYINNSAENMVAAREVLNMVSVMTAMPWLRMVSYSAFAGLENTVKAANTYDKAHIKEGGTKLGQVGAIAKSLTIDVAKRQVEGVQQLITGQGKGGRLAGGVSVIGGAFAFSRLLGLAEYENAFRGSNMQEGGKKIWEAIEKGNVGDVFKQGAENWVNNAQRLGSYIGLSKNPYELAHKLGEGARPEPLGAESRDEALAEGGQSPVEAGQAYGPLTKEAFTTKESVEKITELATIGKGEGIEHTLIRQLENNPKGFGFNGNADDAVALHRWAGNQAHKIAIANKFVNESSGAEERVQFAKKAIQFILNPDRTIESVNTTGNLYHFKPEQIIADIRAPLELREEAQDKIEKIFRGGPFGVVNQYEEWETVRSLKARDVLEGKFGAYVGKSDSVEVHNREQMQDYLNKIMKHNALSPKENETTESFIQRVTATKEYTKELVKEDITKIYGKTWEKNYDFLKNQSAQDLVDGKVEIFFGEPTGDWIVSEAEEVRGVKKHIQVLINETKLQPKSGESVNDFIVRAEQSKVSADDVAKKIEKGITLRGGGEGKEFIAKKMGDYVDFKYGNSIGNFQYRNGEVVGFFVTTQDRGPDAMNNARKLLYDNWYERLTEHFEEKGQHMKVGSGTAKNIIEGDAFKIYKRKEILEIIEKEKGMNSIEAKYLRTYIAKDIVRCENEYGDLFK